MDSYIQSIVELALTMNVGDSKRSEAPHFCFVDSHELTCTPIWKVIVEIENKLKSALGAEYMCCFTFENILLANTWFLEIHKFDL